MTLNIPFIVAATALLVCATIAKVLAVQPKKADKSQKGDILKQLLALSEGESKISGKASPIKVRTPSSSQSRRPVNTPRKTSTKIAQPVRTGK